MKHGHALQPAERERPRKTGVRDKQRRKHRRHDADRQRESEPFYRATRQPEKNRCCKKLGNVRVENRAESLSVGSINRYTKRFPLFNLIPKPLVDENIRVHRDSQAENETGNTGERKDAVKHAQCAHHHDAVDQQGDVCN